MIEKGRMAVVKKSIKNANSAKRDHSLVPDGVFEKASLYVYSEDAKHKKTREKRAASYGSRRHHNSRRRQKGRNRGHYNCRRHKQYVDFMEVIRIYILFLENKFILELSILYSTQNNPSLNFPSNHIFLRLDGMIG